MRNNKCASIYVRYFALAILAVFLCSISGCSDKDRDSSNKPTPTPTPDQTAPVTFVFDLLAPAKGEVPVAVTHFGFFGYSDTYCNTQIYYEEADKDQTEGVEQQEITINVPVQVVKIRICYYDQNDTVLMESITDTLNLTAGQAQTIKVSETIEPQGATLVLKFAEDVVVPDTSTKCQVNMYDAEGNLACTCTEDDVDPENLHDITIAAVPVNVDSIDLLWQNADNVTCGIHELSGSAIPELAIGETATVTVSGTALDILSDLDLTITNAYNDNNLTAANVQVVYKSESTTERTITGQGTLNGTTCTAMLKGLLGKDVEVLSVTLCNTKNNVPFEWLDYEMAQVVEDDKLTLDVEDNEFANGKYAEGKFMFVANPRQFRNINNHLGGNYLQIKDIDFAGSCGITMDKDGNVTSTDDTARYYNEGKGYTPIAAIEKAPFTGIYDGGTYTENGEEQHYAISGVVSNTSASYTALFGYGKDCTLMNVTIDDTCCIKATGSESIGCLEAIASLVAQLDGQSGSYLLECTSKARIFVVQNGSTSVKSCGGLVGKCGSASAPAFVDCLNCSFEGSISTPVADNVGMVGYACLSSGYFTNCANFGIITANSDTGGVLGQFNQSGSTENSVLFDNCSNSGAISVSGRGAGGVIGCNNDGHVVMLRCSNSGALTAGSQVGGIIGVNDSERASLSIENCSSTGAIEVKQTSGNMHAGGLVGSIGPMSAENFALFENNTVDCLFTYIKTATTLGGVLGYSNNIGADAIKAKLQGHVEVTDKCAATITNDSDKKVGKYCGDPYVDSLEE